MILTHLVLFSFLGGASATVDATPTTIDGGGYSAKRKHESIYMLQERANNEPRQEVFEEALKEVAEAVSAPIAERIEPEQAEAAKPPAPLLEVLPAIREAVATAPAEPAKPELTAAQKLDTAITQYFAEHQDEGDDEDAIAAALYALLSALDSPGTAHA